MDNDLQEGNQSEPKRTKAAGGRGSVGSAAHLARKSQNTTLSQDTTQGRDYTCWWLRWSAPFSTLKTRQRLGALKAQVPMIADQGLTAKFERATCAAARKQQRDMLDRSGSHLREPSRFAAHAACVVAGVGSDWEQYIKQRRRRTPVHRNLTQPSLGGIKNLNKRQTTFRRCGGRRITTLTVPRSRCLSSSLPSWSGTRGSQWYRCRQRQPR